MDDESVWAFEAHPLTSNDRKDDSVSEFSEQVRSVDGHFAVVRDLSAVRDYVYRLAETSKSKMIVIADGNLTSRLFPLDSIPGNLEVSSKATLARHEFLAALKTADIGVSTVELAIAETGTLIVSTSDERERLVTALPTIHVAIVPRSCLVSSLHDAEPLVSDMLRRTKRGLTISLISASSRTSDIGDQIILGMHGPKELHVLLLNQDLGGT